ncbi:MAG: transpeptidase family protein [Bacteroidia bacterium]|nr:transpeptidase family protein [Bacteroidia bacterium]NNJ56606.1 transpeptidase family protein [Bacteroidia bacterium]
MKKSIMWRVVFCMVAVVLFAVWISVQMFKIQLIQGPELLSQSDSITIKRQDISPARGNIYSDDGSLLATSMPIYQIRWDATVCKEDTFRKYVNVLAASLEQMYPENTESYYRTMLKKARADGNRYKLIRRRVNYTEQKILRAMPIFNKGRYRGGFVSELTTKRVKPAGQLAFRTIGYRTKDNPGVGLERSYENDLGGVKGERLVQRISGGYRPINDENLIEPQNGRDVHTTLNIDFQEIAQRSLSAAIDKHNAMHGSVIVMEVATGKIKAISNLKNMGEGKYLEQYNYAIGESYEPGSVWKVFSAMAAFEDNLVKPSDTVNLMNGFREYFGKPMRDSDQGRFKKASFIDAFARSSNVAFSSLIFDNYSSAPNKYISYLKKLDLDKPTGIEIKGEPNPVLNHPASNSWSQLTLPWLAIGYENLHTPLQLLTAYNGIINNGEMVKPRIVEKVTDAGLVIRDFDEMSESKRVCSQETSDYIKLLTAAVFEKGSARKVQSKVLPLAGKTGTAQISTKGQYQTSKKYNASFIGHFPADKPVYSIYVMINEPRNGVFYASAVAAPVFTEIAEKIYTINVKQEINEDNKGHLPVYTAGYYSDFKEINKVTGLVLSEEVSSEIVQINTETKNASPKNNSEGKMPDVMGLGAKDAIYLLELRGLKPKITGYGRVVEQSPNPGIKVESNRTVYIRLN